jgi:hypothetical protein
MPPWSRFSTARWYFTVKQSQRGGWVMFIGSPPIGRHQRRADRTDKTETIGFRLCTTLSCFANEWLYRCRICSFCQWSRAVNLRNRVRFAGAEVALERWRGQCLNSPHSEEDGVLKAMWSSFAMSFEDAADMNAFDTFSRRLSRLGSCQMRKCELAFRA